VAEILTWLVVFVRATALLAVFPVISTHNVPVQLRVALGALAAALLTPFIPHLDPNHDWFQLTYLLFSEASVGLLLGLLSRTVFYAVDIAGSIIANEIGLSLSGVINPMTANTSPVPAVLLQWLAIVLFFSLDLHAWFIVGLQKSYSVLGPGSVKLTQVLFEGVLSQTTKMFVIALQITAPILAISFVITLGFAIAGRVIPQMNLLSESFPVRIMAGLMVLGGSCTLIGQHLLNRLGHIPGDMDNIASLLTGR
jgi:flagellar biosynthesis protein FliR